MLRPRFQPIAGRVGASLLALMCVTAATSAVEPRTPPGPASIAVTGEGQVAISPDRALVSIGIDSDAPTSAAAAADNARRTRAVVAALRAAGAAATDIRTQSYSVQPQWQYSPSAPPHRKGYRASMQLQLSVSNLPRLGPWIDAALSAGASGIGEVHFDSSQLPGAHQQALTLAVQHARADADTLARAAGGTLGTLLELSTQQPSFQPGLQEAVVTAERREAPDTSFQNTQLQVHASVLARWSFVSNPP